MVSCVNSQNQTNNWYFGENAGLSFANGEVSVLNDGAMDTPNGCTTISDKQGNLLFYSNGETIWNKNHQIVENGENLSGENTNNQSVIIISHPKTTDRFYVFCTRRTTTFDGSKRAGLYYSEIRITPEYPNGEVTVKNILLRPRVTEKLAATYNPSDDTVNLLVFGKNINNDIAPFDTFFIYKIGQNGFTGGTVSSVQVPSAGTNGPLKISPNNKYIAIADYEGTAIQIYDFDINSSTITLKDQFETFIPFATLNIYGLEFSQDSNILYFCSSNILLKYSIEPTEGFGRRQMVGSSYNHQYGNLQLARNGKIYVATYDEYTGSNQLGVINNPNEFAEMSFDTIPSGPDESNFIELSQDLGTGSSQMGLPIFLASELRNRIITENRCANEAFEFDLDAYDTIDSVVWDFGDGNTSTQMMPSHLYSNPGNYKVKATITIGDCTIDLYKDVEAFVVPNPLDGQTLTQCVSNIQENVIFNLYEIENQLNLIESDNEFIFYSSLEDADLEQNEIQNPESYENLVSGEELFVKITSQNACSDTTNFFLETISISVQNLEPLIECESSDGIEKNEQASFNLDGIKPSIIAQFNLPGNLNVGFYGSENDAYTEQNKLPDNYNTESKTIWVRIENSDNGCSGIGTLDLIVNNAIDIPVNDNYTLCYDPIASIINLDGGGQNNSWEWRDSSGLLLSTQRFYEVTDPGEYLITSYYNENNVECSLTKNFTVEEAGIASIDTVETGNGKVELSVIGDADYEYSLNGNDFSGSGNSHTFLNVRGGTYTVYIRDKDNCQKPLQTEVSLISFPRFLTPNGDGSNDYWRILGLSPNFYQKAEIIIFDRYGKLLYQMDLNQNRQGWNGKIRDRRLNSNDYWFKVEMIDHSGAQRMETGHFTLKN